MKAVLSNRVILNADSEFRKELTSKLTYVIPQNFKIKRAKNRRDIKICDIKTVSQGIISIPIGAAHLIPDHYEVVDKRTSIPVDFPEASFTLRPEQQEVYDLVEDSCLIIAPPAWGKSYTGISLITKLKQKTLIVVHTSVLRDQWALEIRKTLGIEPGVVGGGKFDVSKSITVATVQTLQNHIDTVHSMFGLILLDECHHTLATTFQSIIDKLKARYKIGLTATLFRKDGKHVIIPDYFSNNIIEARSVNQLVPSIKVIPTNFHLADPMDWANSVNKLKENPEYGALIIDTAQTMASKGHKVLVVSDRVEFLKALDSICDNSVCVTGLTKDRQYYHDLLDTDEYNILFGGIGIYKEGVNIPKLSCLILGTPLSGTNEGLLEQLVGRITRSHPDKLPPVVIDIRLGGNFGYKQSMDRIAFYRRMGYDIEIL